MSVLLDTLFGLEGLGFGDDGTRLAFARPLPAWGWALVVVGAGLIAWWSYRRLLPGRVRRVLLPGLRATAILTLAVLLAGPQLVRDRERIERDWVAVLIDRSRSLEIPDAPAGEGLDRASRETQLRRALVAAEPAFAAIARDHEILWLGFDDAAYELPTVDAAATPTLGPPEGNATRLGNAISTATRRLAGRPVSALIVLSDGRSSDTISAEAERRLLAEGVPVLTVPLGQEGAVRDIAISRVTGPSAGFLGDPVPIRVRIEWSGDERPAGTVRVTDAATGLTLGEVDLSTAQADPDDTSEPGSDTNANERAAEVSVAIIPDAAGDAVWAVTIETDTEDLIAENNRAEHRIELIDRPIRVAYFDGYPRWEQRYLKNILIREPSVRVAGTLLSSGRRYEQDGDLVLDALPTSPEEWAQFDVIILGDLRPGLFGQRQLEMLADHISLRGAGLLWIAGPGATPGEWFDSPLAPLLPITQPRSTKQSGNPIVVRRTPDAERLGLLALESSDGARSGWPAVLTDRSAGWPVLRWHQPIALDEVKPSAAVLAEALSDAGNSPLVLTMRYGAGAVAFVGTDEIWRWRYGRGEDLPERFWLPLVRSLARESAGRSGQPAILTATPEAALVGTPVALRLRLADQSLIDTGLDAVEVRIVSIAPDGTETEDSRARLTPDQPVGVPAISYSAAWTPGEVGRYRIEPAGGALDGLDLGATVEVRAPGDELRAPEADHAALKALAERTGGRVVAPEDLASLADLPNRARVTFGTPEIATLWDRPLSLVLLLLVLSAEWIGRRLSKLD